MTPSGTTPGFSRSDASGGRAEDHLAMQRAQDLVDPRARPDPEERRLLELGEFTIAALLRLFLALARPRRANAPDHVVLQVDRRELGVVIEVVEVLRVEDRDRNRLPRLAVLGVEELGHDVGVAVGRLGEARLMARAEPLPVAAEDPELHAAGPRQARGAWHIRAA